MHTAREAKGSYEQNLMLMKLQALRQQVELIAAVAERTIASPHDRADIETAMLRLSQVLATDERRTQ